MKITNLLIPLIESAEMDPHGVLTGIAGACLSLFWVNHNSFGAVRSLGTIIAGIIVCGYLFVWMEEMIDSRALVMLLNLAAGFIVSDVLSTLKSNAPTIVRKIYDYLVKFIPTKENKND